MEYKAHIHEDHFNNDWYEFIEYGTTNKQTVFLQQSGFSRESSIFIQSPENRAKYITVVNGERKIKRSILRCGNLSVETDAKDVQFNMPELFID